MYRKCWRPKIDNQSAFTDIKKVRQPLKCLTFFMTYEIIFSGNRFSIAKVISWLKPDDCQRWPDVSDPAHSGYFNFQENSYRSRVAKYEQVTFAHRAIKSAVGLMAVILGTESPLYFPRQLFSFWTARCMIEIHVSLVVPSPTVYMDKYGTLVAALILPVHAVHRIHNAVAGEIPDSME